MIMRWVFASGVLDFWAAALLKGYFGLKAQAQVLTGLNNLGTLPAITVCFCCFMNNLLGVKSSWQFYGGAFLAVHFLGFIDK